VSLDYFCGAGYWLVDGKDWAVKITSAFAIVEILIVGQLVFLYKCGIVIFQVLIPLIAIITIYPLYHPSVEAYSQIAAMARSS